jgi:hypothetical protein
MLTYAVQVEVLRVRLDVFCMLAAPQRLRELERASEHLSR